MTVKRSAFLFVMVVLAVGLLLASLSAAAFLLKDSSSDYRLVSVWGGEGEGPGEFTYPSGVKIYRNELFVVDTNSHRIQVFDLDGAFIRQFGEPGTAPGQLNRPWNIFFADGELYVAGYGSNRIDVLDPDGSFKRTIELRGGGAFDGPISLARDANDHLIVVDFYNHRIVRMTSEGEFVSQWGTTGRIGIGAGEFNYPMDLVTSRDGRLVYVADSYNDRIQVFGADGEFKFKWGGPFAANLLVSAYDWFPFDGWFAVASAIAMDRLGTLYVGDWRNKRIQVFSGDGTFLTAFGAEGDDALGGVSGIAVADDGSVFVVDQGKRVVQKWQPTSPGTE